MADRTMPSRWEIELMGSLILILISTPPHVVMNTMY